MSFMSIRTSLHILIITIMDFTNLQEGASVDDRGGGQQSAIKSIVVDCNSLDQVEDPADTQQ